MSEEHWCQCDNCTQERIDQQARIDTLTAEVEEQARLLGASGSREAKLQARIDALEKELAPLEGRSVLDTVKYVAHLETALVEKTEQWQFEFARKEKAEARIDALTEAHKKNTRQELDVVYAEKGHRCSWRVAYEAVRQRSRAALLEAEK